MAVITQRENGAWQAKIRRRGHPSLSRTFDRKGDAEAWARATEREMDVGAFVPRTAAETTTFGDAVDRYKREVLPRLRAQRQPAGMLDQLKERFGKYSLVAITPAMLASYRDERLKAVSAQTVVHELGLVSRVLKACVMDWGIPLPQGIPTTLVRKPKLPPGRDRRLEGEEEAILLAALGRLRSPWPKAAFILAIETAARQSELLSLTWDEVDLVKRTARLRGKEGGPTKSSAPYRDVPLTLRAVSVLKALPKSTKGVVLPVSQNALRLTWERALASCRRSHVHELLGRELETRGIAAKREISALVYKKREPLPVTLELLKKIDGDDRMLVDLRWHDLRHEATSRLADRLELHELMKVTGHASSTMLSRYYHPRAEDLAAKLA